MGFSTWSYGPDLADIDDTHSFLDQYRDIQTIQMDDKIPWNAWINGTALPSDYIADVDGRVFRLPNDGTPIILSISPLNTGRDNIIEDWENGAAPSYSFGDTILQNAFIEHIKYLVDAFNPTYLIFGMETNDLLVHAEDKWDDFRSLMTKTKTELQLTYPTLKMTESMTLHNWY